MTAATYPIAGHALTRVERLAQALPAVPNLEVASATSWGRAEFRSTSAWSFPEVLGELGRFNSAPWIGQVDVPTSVVVTAGDRAIPARRQRRLAEEIKDAEAFTAPGGHASLVLDTGRWVPEFLAAVESVTNRVKDAGSATGTRAGR
jgi:hypothetical protein